MEGSMSGPKIFSQLEPRKLVKLWMAGAVFTAALIPLTCLTVVLEEKGSKPLSQMEMLFDYLLVLALLAWSLVPPAMTYLAWKITVVSRPLLEFLYPAVRLAGKRQLVLLWTVAAAIMLLWIIALPFLGGVLIFLLAAMGIIDLTFG
jgi:heme/copper-type cytochrome/quinol oxidase subunit 2